MPSNPRLELQGTEMMSDSSQPQIAYTTATAFLETASSSDPFIIPTSSPAPEQPEAEPLLAQPEHALASSTLFPPNARGFILARVIGDELSLDESILELRWTSFTAGTRQSESKAVAVLGDMDQLVAPVKFKFPAKLVASPPALIWAEESRTLQVFAVTEAGYLYSLTFSSPRLFGSPTLGERPFSEEFKVDSLEGRLPVLYHAVPDGRVVVACADGYTVSVEIEEQGAGIIETELRAAASFSLRARALLPSFSTRNISSRLPAATQSASSQLLSLAASIHEDGSHPFAFGATRDRKLKIWDLETGVCLKTLDLPRPATSHSMELELHRARDTESPGKQASTLLPPTPRSLLKLFSDSHGASFLVIFVPATGGSPPSFSIYEVLRNAAGVLSELSPLAERIAPMSGALVDFDVSEFGIDGEQGQWTLWTTWEENGEADIKHIAVPEIGGGVNGTSSSDWATIDRRTGSSEQWTAGYFDDLLRDNLQPIAEVFADHIFFPGRYPPATLDYALAVYDEALTEETGVHNRPELFHLETATVEEKICTLVGCSIELEVSEQTGAYLHDAYDKRLKLEWLRFVAICNESRSAALFPLYLALSPADGTIAVVQRDALVVPIAQDDILHLRHIASSPSLTDAFIQQSPPNVRIGRQDLLLILQAMKHLSSALSTPAARQLEDDLLATARAPLPVTVEEAAREVYVRSVAPHVDDATRDQVIFQLNKLDTPDVSFEFLAEMLTTTNLNQAVQAEADDFAPDDANRTVSDLTGALLADALRTVVEARYAVSKDMLTLLVFMQNHLDDYPAGDSDALGSHFDDFVGKLESFTSKSLATFHTLASLRWVTHQPVSAPDDPSDDSMAGQFERLGVSDTSSSKLACTSLLNDLLLKTYPSSESRDLKPYSPLLSTSIPLPRALINAMGAFLRSTGLIQEKRFVEDSIEDAEFGSQLRKMGLPELAVDFVVMYPRGSGMLYVLARSYLELGRTEEAQSSFLRAASAFGGGVARLDQHQGFTAVVTSSHASSSLARYYEHVTNLFHEQGVKSAVVTFARLALESFADEGSTDDKALEELWLKLFNGNAELGEYEDAYAAMMSVPYHKTKIACLNNLLTVLCEDGQVGLLTRLSFVGLQAELERILAFRARSSKPLSGADYYPTLYAYHIAKGDYRSAADAMLQRARHLGADSSAGRNHRNVSTLQCQSYLAAINALSLVDPEHAWLANDLGLEADDRANKRRKIVCHIPNDKFRQPRNVKVVDLPMIRSEYTIALGRLQLLNKFPESELIRTGLDVVSGLRQADSFDAAFSAAQMLEEDMSPTFRRLTEKCMSLSATDALSTDVSWIALSDEALPWEGSLASKGWRLLERHLKRYDSSTYYLAVLDEMFTLDRDARIPPFLSDYFIAHDPQPFLRILIEFNRLPEAFRFALRTIKPSSAGPRAQMTFPSYTLFDQLLSLKASTTLSITAEELQARQEEVRTALSRR